MAIVAGVDFGTLSVRVSLVDSSRGLIASAASEYPLHRKKEDPDYATQSHDDHMRALATATRQAVKKRESMAIRSKRLRWIRQAPAWFRSARVWCRWTTTTCGAITAPGMRRRRLRNWRTRRGWKPYSGAEACIRRNGVSLNCCTGSVTTLASVKSSSPPSNTATWSLPPCAALRIPRKPNVAFVRWATSGCGIQLWAAFRRRAFSPGLTHSWPASGPG